MPRTLVLVESPNKAKKIQAFLGADTVVRASFGHVCDLPKKGYGVDLRTFEETYELRNSKVIAEIRQIVRDRGVERILLATDPDREGEAIAWHLARELKLSRSAAQRIEFREITATAVRAAVANPRPVDLARVDAQRARRVLDRVVGFDVSSEICWPAGAQSAGRVQTPALHILCEREREILAFVVDTYFTLSATYAEGFTAFVPDDGPELEQATDGADADDADGRKRGSRVRPRKFRSREDAEAARAEAARHPHIVQNVAKRRTETRPDPPYTTSTMQQDASRKLRLSAKQAADLAQQLFEAGLITYHRTDSVRVSADAVADARAFIATKYPEALPARPPAQRTKAGAQDAHEAIRPTHLEGGDAPPPAAAKLLEMIRARFLASQCKPAVFDRTAVRILAGPVPFAAQGSVLVEHGYLRFWGPYARQEDDVLPALAAGQTLGAEAFAVEQKQTTPPSRYDTGALIRKLEISGIGRPATFASIIETLLQREYVHELKAARGKTVLQPTSFGLQVDGLLTSAFPELVSEAYTASMERELDRIEGGEGETRVGYLTRWFGDFRGSMKEALVRASAYRVEHRLQARPQGGPARGEETSTRCDRCGEANYRKLTRRKGKGVFLACGACNMMRDVRAATRPAACPKCGSALIERRGKQKGTKFFGCVRYGAAERPCAYVEAGSPSVAGAPRQAPVSRAMPAPASSLAETNARVLAATAPEERTKPSRGATAAASTRAMPPAVLAGEPVRRPTSKACPKCAKATLDVVEHAGSPDEYMCPRPRCAFRLTVGNRRRTAPCPVCQGVVVERREGQGGRGAPRSAHWSCARRPACDFTAPIA